MPTKTTTSKPRFTRYRRDHRVYAGIKTISLKDSTDRERFDRASPVSDGPEVHLALSTAKPKARYAVIKQRFKNWTLPRLLPARMLDAVIAKQLGFVKP